MQLVGEAQGAGISQVLGAMLDRLVPHLKERRLLPLKNPAGQASLCIIFFAFHAVPHLYSEGGAVLDRLVPT